MATDKEMISVFNRQVEYFRRQSTKSLTFRLDALRKLKSAIIRFESEIMAALYADLHKSEFESYISEVGIVLDEISSHIRQLKRWMKPERVDSGILTFPSRSMIISEPKGQVLIIAPWNYPFQLVMAPLAGVISAGNTAIIKPSEISKHTSAVIEKLIVATFESKYIAVFQGDASVSRNLLQRKFDHIFFTGSPRVGGIVMQEAAKQLIPVTLELGGKSPCIVDREIDIKLTARRIVWGKFLNAGQTCVAPDYLMVHADVEEPLLKELGEAIKAFYGENPELSDAYPRMISKAAVVRLATFIEEGIVVHGGKFSVEDQYVEPTIMTNISPDAELMQQEIFGPVLPVFTYTELDEVAKFVNTRPKPLALYCFSNNRAFVKRILTELPAGGVTVNDTLMHYGNNRLPFGGTGNSGLGQYHGKFSFDVFSHKKAVMVRATWLDVPLRYPPFGKKLNYLKMLMK
ncbi:MAG: aldehyde dehydrogenase [Bacteroidales bacterium]|jgi:aldehyde dehydrogenase (NAD+)